MLTREYNGHVGMEIPATENLLRQNLLISCRQASRSQSIWETESLCAFYPSPASRLDFALSSQPEYLFQGTGKGLRLHTKIYGFAKKQKIVAVLLVIWLVWDMPLNHGGTNQKATSSLTFSESWNSHCPTAAPLFSSSSGWTGASFLLPTFPPGPSVERPFAYQGSFCWDRRVLGVCRTHRRR